MRRAATNREGREPGSDGEGLGPTQNRKDAQRGLELGARLHCSLDTTKKPRLEERGFSWLTLSHRVRELPMFFERARAPMCVKRPRLVTAPSGTHAEAGLGAPKIEAARFLSFVSERFSA